MEPNTAIQEREMQQAYQKAAEAVLCEQDRFEKTAPRCRVGFECEVALVGNGFEYDSVVRNAIVQAAPKCIDLDVELGATQLELRTRPVFLEETAGLQTLRSEIELGEHYIAEAAHSQGVQVLRCGLNPFLCSCAPPRTDKPKYQLVPDYYNRHRPTDANLRVGRAGKEAVLNDAALVSLFQAFQINTEAAGATDAVQKLNYSLMLGPYLLAIAGNARFIGTHDTEMADCRQVAWERTHDTGMCDARSAAWERTFTIPGSLNRVGLPGSYFVDLREYLERAGKFPFIFHSPENALSVGLGMTWLDSRVKVVGDSLVVELRGLPTQPHPEAELQLALWYVGRLAFAQAKREPLLPLGKVSQNRNVAMLDGSGCSMWFPSQGGCESRHLPFREGFERESKKAEDGLRHLGLSHHFDASFFRERTRKGPPSDTLATEFHSRDSNSLSALTDALRTCGMLH